MKPDALADELRRKRGIVVSLDDPAMLVGAIIELQLEEVTATIQGLLQASRTEVAAQTEQELEAAREIGQKIVGTSASWIAGQIRSASEAALKQMAAELDERINRLQSIERRTILAMSWACVAAATTSCAVVLWFLG